MDKDYIINHLKDLVKMEEKDIKSYEENGNKNMRIYSDGIKNGLEIAINWLELQDS